MTKSDAPMVQPHASAPEWKDSPMYEGNPLCSGAAVPLAAASPDVAKMVKEAKRLADHALSARGNAASSPVKDLANLWAESKAARAALLAAIDALGAAATPARAAVGAEQGQGDAMAEAAIRARKPRRRRMAKGEQR